jgi:hypothetical protein
MFRFVFPGPSLGIIDQIGGVISGFYPTHKLGIIHTHRRPLFIFN